MKKFLSRFAALTAILLVTGMWVSCSDNSEDGKYASLAPRFSDLTLVGSDGTTTLKTGDKIVATAVQEQQGRLLYKATYEWQTSLTNGVTHLYTKGVVYDHTPINPTDTIVFELPGRYTLTFKGKYWISGGCTPISEVVSIPSGKITYTTPSSYYYGVEIEKTFNVVKNPDTVEE